MLTKSLSEEKYSHGPSTYVVSFLHTHTWKCIQNFVQRIFKVMFWIVTLTSITIYHRTLMWWLKEDSNINTSIRRSDRLEKLFKNFQLITSLNIQGFNHNLFNYSNYSMSSSFSSLNIYLHPHLSRLLTKFSSTLEEKPAVIIRNFQLLDILDIFTKILALTASFFKYRSLHRSLFCFVHSENLKLSIDFYSMRS